MATAATHSDDRASDQVASARATWSESTLREASVDVERSGHHTRTDNPSGIGSDRAVVPAATVNPPSADAAALSGCPSRSVAVSNETVRARSCDAPAVRAARYAPATRAAPEKPSPRPGGMGLRQCSGMSGSPPAATNATTAGCVGSAASHPSGCSSTARPKGRSSASPRQSKPGPRFADDAGAVTITTPRSPDKLSPKRRNCVSSRRPATTAHAISVTRAETAGRFRGLSRRRRCPRP